MVLFLLRAGKGNPSRKPFLKRLRTTLRCLQRPVPVVFLLFALVDQLKDRILAPGYPHWAHLDF